jgi:hypothetical protein
MMWATFLNKLRWSYRKNAPELRALLTRNYPDFVFSRRPAPLRGEIPVFVFHSVEPISFEEKLQFLAHNKYRTLNGEEFRLAIAGESKMPENSILLTFDDGTASLWTVAFPILRKYGFRAVSFIIPGCIPDYAPESPTFLDYEKKQPLVEALLDREQGEHPLCSWEEIREMHSSGVIDFQSHTLYHHRICVSPTLIDFIHPNFDRYYHSNVNMPVYRVNGTSNFTRQMPWGTPVYRFEPRMASRLQYFDDEAVRAICIEYVAKQGGEFFFRRKDWRKQLYIIYHQAKKYHNNGEYETPSEQAKTIFEDLQQAKKLIEERLSGKIIDQLCYPWFVGSDLAVKQSHRAGYRVNYWGIVPQHKTNRPGDDLFYVPRIDEQYIFRLPGNGRKSLREILSAKVKTNLPHLFGRLKN